MNRKAFVAIMAGFTLTVTAWAWAQQGTTPQQPPTGSAGQGMMGGQAPQGGTGAASGMMGHQGGTGPGGMMGAQTPQGGQGTGPGAMMGPRSGQGTPRRAMGVRRGPSLYERPLISEILSLQQQLGLSAEQVRRLHTLRNDFEKEAIKRSAEVQVAEVDLSSLLEADRPDLSEVEAQVKKVAALQGDLRFARIKTLEQGRAVLSQEQWQKFESLAPRTAPMGPYGGPSRHGQLGPGPSGTYGMMAPGMMGSSGGPGMMGMMGSGMMGGFGGMMGGGPYGQRQFTSNGERIYYTGVNATTGPIPRSGGPMWAEMGGVGCVNCHGVEGRGGVPVMMGTAIPADVRYEALIKGEYEHGKKNTPYTDALIKRAVTEGLDPDGQPLDWTMPRWRMSEQDLNDLITYLRQLR